MQLILLVLNTQLALSVQFREKDKRRPSLVLSGRDEGQLYLELFNMNDLSRW